MALRIDQTEAAELIRLEAHNAETGPVDPGWTEKIERLSQLCRDGASITHIAFLGAVILAKSMNRDADLFAIKPGHAPDNPNAFSARTLCHGVLVPAAAEIGISLGATGREPLNNQPYFRMTRLGDNTPVHPGARRAFDYMVDLVRELQALPDEASARQALRAFIAVRKRHQKRYDDYEAADVKPERLLAAIEAFVADASEGGRRAQAVVAGLMDAFAGPERVESGRVNDPSRKYPGDVCVRLASDPKVWEKAIEVRDKRVTEADVRIFAKKCVDMGVREAAMIMVARDQVALDEGSLHRWASDFGIGLTLFAGWDTFFGQALFWSEQPKPVAASQAALLIYDRLKAVEASAEAITLWQSLISSG